MVENDRDGNRDRLGDWGSHLDVLLGNLEGAELVKQNNWGLGLLGGLADRTNHDLVGASKGWNAEALVLALCHRADHRCKHVYLLTGCT